MQFRSALAPSRTPAFSLSECLCSFALTPTPRNGTTTSTSSRPAGRRRTGATTGSFRASASTASRRAASSPTSTRRRSTSARSKATRCIPAAAGAPARRASSRRTSSTIRTASSIRCRRDGERGAGEWERVSWDEALDDIGGRIRKAIVEDRRHEVMYHVGRPGEDGYVNRVLQAWGVDGHNSHTNVCSSSARLGHFLWCGDDRPSPDYANAQTILLLSSHLETGPLLQPARAAHHRGPVARREAHRHRPAPVEHVGEGRHLAAGVSGHRRRRCCWRWRT